MSYQYFICDVFTDEPFFGNPLAVIPRAEGLSDEQMQNIAREFNFSETTFVFPPRQGQTKQVRIFTPTREIPFAGHPNVGTAFVLAETEPKNQRLIPSGQNRYEGKDSTNKRWRVEDTAHAKLRESRPA